jgi:energy-coupling factor transporter ATP-binding protein EcfA2
MSEKRCPYPGLRPFNEEEAIYFKGRDLHIRQITKQLEERKIIMITGASGDGKSSLVYAGLIPNARAGFFHAEYNNWVFIDFKPERNPLKNIAQSLALQLDLDLTEIEEKLQFGFSSLVDIYKSSKYFIDKNGQEWKNANEKTKKELRNNAGNLFILADQFEEFFTNNENFSSGVPSINAYTAVNLLLETANIALYENLPIYIVFTMRSDFISQCVAFKGLPEIIGYSQFFVPRLKRNEIKQVIEEPALLSGGKISNRLTEVLINELRDGFDQLPVLQHALNQLWELAGNGEQELDLIHLAKLAGMRASFLNTEDKAEFDNWFKELTHSRKAYFEKPTLNNILNAHADMLYETAYNYFTDQVNWAQKNISKEDAKLILKVVFQSLTKIDDGRAVRNRMSLKEITHIINREDISYDIVCGVLNIFRLPDSTFIRPFINLEDLDTQYIPADTILDITHEALIRNWQLLKSWEIEEENNLNDFKEFKVQLNRWTSNNKSKEFLLASGTLNYFEKWFSRCNLNPYWISKYDVSKKDKKEKLNEAIILNQDTKQYLENSRTSIKQIEKAKKRRKNIALVIALVVIFILSGFVTWALKEKSFAQQQELIANEQKAEANSQSKQAEDEKNKAIEANNRAEKNATAALEAKKLSDEARKFSETMRSLAEEKSLLAQKETNKAQLEKQRADKQRQIAEIASDSAKTLSLLSTSQSLAFKAKQTYNNKQLNLFAAWYANYYNSNYGGSVRNAVVYEGLRYSLETNGYSNIVYTSSKQLNTILKSNDSTVLLIHNNGDFKKLDATTFAKKNSCKFKYTAPIDRAILVSDYMITSYEDGVIQIWNLITEQSYVLSDHSEVVTDAVRINDYLITAARDKTIKTWDLTNIEKGAISTINTNSRVNTLVTNGVKIYAGLFNGHLISFNINETHFEKMDSLTSSITALNFNSKSKLLISGTSLGKVRIYDTENNNKLIHEISNNETLIESIATDATSTILAIASSDKTIQIFDIYDLQKKPLLINDHHQNTKSMFINSNGLLVVHCADNSIRVWETNCQNYADTIKNKIKRKPTIQEWKQLVGNNINYPN